MFNTPKEGMVGGVQEHLFLEPVPSGVEPASQVSDAGSVEWNRCPGGPSTLPDTNGQGLSVPVELVNGALCCVSKGDDGAGPWVVPQNMIQTQIYSSGEIAASNFQAVVSAKSLGTSSASQSSFLRNTVSTMDAESLLRTPTSGFHQSPSSCTEDDESEYAHEPYDSSTLLNRRIGSLDRVRCELHGKERSAQNMVMVQHKRTGYITWRCKSSSECKVRSNARNAPTVVPGVGLAPPALVGMPSFCSAVPEASRIPLFPISSPQVTPWSEMLSSGSPSSAPTPGPSHFMLIPVGGTPMGTEALHQRYAGPPPPFPGHCSFVHSQTTAFSGGQPQTVLMVAPLTSFTH